jgi:hypothetical protein
MAFLADAFAWLAATLEASAPEVVTYARGRKTATVTLVRGRNTPQALAIADGRANLMVVPQDWLVRPAQIDFGDGPVDPADGDRITTAAGEVYELAPRDSEPSWRKSDPDGSMLRLRTVREG